MYCDETKYASSDPSSEWPLNLNPTTDIEKSDLIHIRSKQLAYFLLQFERDVREMQDASPAENGTRQTQIHDEWTRADFAQGFDVGLISHSKTTSEDEVYSTMTMPTLGPLHGESRLEIINRLWHVLQYLPSTQTGVMAQEVWPKCSGEAS